MSEEFNDEIERHTHIEFDWDEVARGLGEDCPADNELLPPITGPGVDYKHVRMAVLGLMRWAVQPTLQKRNKKQPSAIVFKRVIAMAWVMCPELFSADGKQARSMSEVANAVKMHKAVLSEFTAEFSKTFGFRNKFQIGHGWNFKNDPTKQPETDTHENNDEGKNQAAQRHGGRIKPVKKTGA